LNNLLRQGAGLSLSEAKRAVDRILAGEEVSITVPDSESAEQLSRSASELGARCRIE
jgi:ribosomal protein L7/L12